MNLDFFNNLANNLKENKIIQNFMKELGEYLEKLCERKTILVISHEKELAQLAKEVISITEDGCVREKEG